MIINIGLLIIGLGGLFLGGNWLVDGASRLARSFGMPPLIIGLTIVAFGTSSPELMVSLRAAISGASDIAIGNVVGSNIANVGLILGVTGLVLPIHVEESLVRREIPLTIGISVVCLFLFLDGEVGRIDGLFLFVGFIAFNVLMFLLRPREKPLKKKDVPTNTEGVNRMREFGRLVVGIAVLLVGAEATVSGATAIALNLGISEIVIGLTVVAFGTSLPELAASLIAAFRGQSDIAVGNVIGSNVANLLLILGLTSLVQPIPINDPGVVSFANGFAYDPGLLSFNYPIMIGFSLLLLPFALDSILERWEATIFIVAYAGFMVLSFVMA